MGKAGGVIGIIAGIFGLIAAVVTLFLGRMASAFETEGAKAIVGLGWGGVLFSFLAIVFGAIAIGRPKGAGIGLIIVSILGAILGGTLVAICMALSLIGGILAVAGAKNIKPAISSVSDMDVVTGKKSAWGWMVAAGAGVALIVLVLVSGQGAAKPKTDPLAELTSAQVSTLQPDGELFEIFTFGSKYTDLQRENKLNEIKGHVVQWQLPVYEVSRSGDGYKIQTKSSPNVSQSDRNLVGTFIYITPHNDKERQIVETLKTDDTISFKGIIADTTMRSLDIKPAILVAQPLPVAQATLVPQPAQPVQALPQHANMLFLVGKDLDSALDDPLLKPRFEKLLGDKLGAFRERMNVSSGITQDGEWIVGEGGMPHLFSIEEAAFAINTETSEMFAIMLTDGKNINYFGATEVTSLPAPLQTWYKAHGGT